MIPNAFHVLGHAFFLGLDGEPVDVIALSAARTLAAIVPAIRVDGSGFQAAGEQIAHDFIGEQLHAAVGVMDDEPFPRSQQFIRNHQGTNGVFTGASAGVAYHVGVALRQTGVFGRVQARIHASQNGETTRRL